MLSGRAVTVLDMAEAREKRVWLQREALKSGKTVLSFSLNIPGPIKDAPILRQAFWEGERQILTRLRPVGSRRIEAFTGWEGIYLMDQPAEAVKKLAEQIEETHPLGRLFDMDVFDQEGKKLSREGFRRCLLCERQAQLCARSRSHSVRELTAEIERMLIGWFSGEIGAIAKEALCYEVMVTPKPGLVDRNNNGSHRDMDLGMFLKSAEALESTFTACAEAGMTEKEPAGLFDRLRQIGLDGEQAMERATGGVNTHKGAIFSVGLLCGGVGQAIVGGTDPVGSVRRMAPEFLRQEQIEKGGFGSALYREKRCGGIRAEAAEGFPTVMQVGLPVYRAALQQGYPENDAGVKTLLALIARTDDSNMIRRGGEERAAAVKKEIADRLPLLRMEAVMAYAAELDRRFIGENLSPGGSADLLAVTRFLDRAAAAFMLQTE